MAYLVAMKSKDEATHCGSVIVGPDNEVISVGYNSFVKGINDSVPERQLRPEKYLWFEHGERNAIYLAARRGIPNGCRMYVTGLPCAPCARAIIQCGIKKVIIKDRKSFGGPEKTWDDDHKATIQMFKEAEIDLQIFEGDFIREIYEFTRGEKY